MRKEGDIKGIMVHVLPKNTKRVTGVHTKILMDTLVSIREMVESCRNVVVMGYFNCEVNWRWKHMGK